MRFQKVALGSLMIFATLATIGFGSRSFGVTSSQFRMASRRHIRDMQRELPETYLMARGRFPDLTLELVEEYATYHDIPKVMTLSELRKYGYQGKEDIATILARYHGVNMDALGEAGASGIHARSELNRIETLVKNAFFYGHLRVVMHKDKVERIRKQMDELERIVDWTITCLFRRDELKVEETGEYIGACHLADWAHAPTWQIDLSKRLENMLRESHHHESVSPHKAHYKVAACRTYLQ